MVRWMLAAACVMMWGCGASGREAASVEPAVDASATREAVRDDQVVMRVNGLSCPLCATNVEGQLKRLPGVNIVDIDLDEGLVSVSMSGKERPTRAQIARAIEDAGFTVVGDGGAR